MSDAKLATCSTDKLYFPGPYKEAVHCIITLTNATATADADAAPGAGCILVYKIKTTSPTRYNVRPRMGVIFPSMSGGDSVTKEQTQQQRQHRIVLDVELKVESLEGVLRSASTPAELTQAVKAVGLKDKFSIDIRTVEREEDIQFLKASFSSTRDEGGKASGTGAGGEHQKMANAKTVWENIQKHSPEKETYRSQTIALHCDFTPLSEATNKNMTTGDEANGTTTAAAAPNGGGGLSLPPGVVIRYGTNSIIGGGVQSQFPAETAAKRQPSLSPSSRKGQGGTNTEGERDEGATTRTSSNAKKQEEERASAAADRKERDPSDRDPMADTKEPKKEEGKAATTAAPTGSNNNNNNSALGNELQDLESAIKTKTLKLEKLKQDLKEVKLRTKRLEDERAIVTTKVNQNAIRLQEMRAIVNENDGAGGKQKGEMKEGGKSSDAKERKIPFFVMVILSLLVGLVAWFLRPENQAAVAYLQQAAVGSSSSGSTGATGGSLEASAKTTGRVGK